MTNRANGPHSWVLDKSVKDNDAERILARCEAEYEEIISRLCRAIGDMQKRRDIDAAVLLQKLMVLAVNDTTDFIKAQAVVMPDVKPNA